MSKLTEIEAIRDAELARRGLPEICYRYEPETGVALIMRGKPGFYPPTNLPPDLADPGAWVARQNARLGVSHAQAEAMFAGSAFGWHLPIADPAAHA